MVDNLKLRNGKEVKIFDIDYNKWLALLWPVTFKDLSLEYQSRDDLTGFSLAHVAALEAAEALQGKDQETQEQEMKIKYANLLRHYKIIEQLKKFKQDISGDMTDSFNIKSTRNGAIHLVRVLHQMIRRHSGEDVKKFPETESVWPNELYQELQDVLLVVEDFLTRTAPPPRAEESDEED